MATPLVDINGQVVQVKPGTREAALGRGQLHGICVRTRRGVKGFEATWYPSGNTATFAGKRGATAFVKAHEAAFYALPRIGADVPVQDEKPTRCGCRHLFSDHDSKGCTAVMTITPVAFNESGRVACQCKRPACLWCAGSSDIVTDADAQLCRDHLAEFDGVSVAQLDRQEAAEQLDLL